MLIDFSGLADSAYDSLLGEASGAGVIFGNTGGVMEAANAKKLIQLILSVHCVNSQRISSLRFRCSVEEKTFGTIV